MIKLILIDFDDTLCMTEEARFTIENAIAIKLGYQPMTRATHKKYWGTKSLDESITDRIPGINPSLFMAELKRALPIAIKNGAVDMISEKNLQTLKEIKQLGIKVAILTSRSPMEVQHLMDKNHPLTKNIDAFYHKGNTIYTKPDPRVYNKPLADFGFKPDEVVYFGDSLGDAQSANGAGIQFVALLESKLKDKKDFEKYHVRYFATTFKDILMYIKQETNEPF